MIAVTHLLLLLLVATSPPSRMEQDDKCHEAQPRRAAQEEHDPPRAVAARARFVGNSHRSHSGLQTMTLKSDFQDVGRALLFERSLREGVTARRGSR